MLTNRSAPHARVAPVLTVADVRAAVAWYADVFGFVEHVRIGAGHRSKLTPEQIKDLKAGNLYVNVHTAKNKGGEVRAQLQP